MALFELRDGTSFVRSDDYLRGGGVTPAGNVLYPPLRVDLLDSQTQARPLDSSTAAIPLDSQTYVVVRN